MYQHFSGQALEHFAQLGYPCPAHHNPAEFVADLVSPESSMEGQAGKDSRSGRSVSTSWRSLFCLCDMCRCDVNQKSILIDVPATLSPTHSLPLFFAQCRTSALLHRKVHVLPSPARMHLTSVPSLSYGKCRFVCTMLLEAFCKSVSPCAVYPGSAWTTW